MRYRRDRRPRRGRQAEVPRFTRGRRGGRSRSSMGRDRDYGTRSRYSEDEDELPPMDDEFMDIDLDEILEVDEDEIEEELLEDEGGEACPPGCAPVEDEGEGEEEGEEKEVEDEDAEEKDEDGEEEEDEGEEKEASAKPATKSKWAPLFTEADVKTLESVQDVALYPYHNGDDPHYVVIANGKPLGEIHLADIEVDADSAELFYDDAFAQGVTDTIEQLGLHNTLDDMNIRYYAAQVTEQAAANAAKHQVQADLETAYQSRLAELKQDFTNNMLLAAEASLKNVFLKNPLRDAIRQNFRGAGVPDAVIVDLFEDAMHTAGADFVNNLITKADEWLGYERDAMNQVEAAIKEADYSHPAERGLQIDPSNPEPEVTAAPKSVPLRSAAPRYSTAAPQDDASADEESIRNFLRSAGTIRRGNG